MLLKRLAFAMLRSMDAKKLNQRMRRYLAVLGKKGGEAGTGDAKRRSPEHYQHMVARRAETRLARQAK